MNYPYGENIMYSVGHQWLAISVKFISGYFPIIKDYKIGILNFILIFQLLLSIIFVYKLLLKFSLNRNFSSIISVGIVMLAPQIFRLTGHLSLSYTLFFPLTWYLLIRIYDSDFKIKFVFILFFINLLWFFTHPYLGIISVLFYFFYLTFRIIKKYEIKKSLIKNILAFVISSIIPIIIFKFFIYLTDTHTGRTDNPSGFFLYNAELDDIFIPHHPPLRSVLDSFVKISQHWEAWSYLGLTAIIVIISIIILNVFNIFKKKKLDLFLNNYHLKAALFSSFILLLFALSIPFKQIPLLLDIFPIVKQFRATGRFTWPFFFVANIIAFYYVYSIFKRQIENGKKIIAYSILIIAAGLLFIESIPYHNEISEDITNTENLFDKKFKSNEYFFGIEQIDSSKYQAIIPLPFYFYGSESYSRPVQPKTLLNSVLFSYHCNIPIITSNLARVSIPESKKIVQLISPSSYIKEIENDLASRKPFLIISTTEQKTNYEQSIINKSKLLFKTKELEFYDISYKSLFENTSNSIISEFKNLKGNLFDNKNFLVNDTTLFLYYNDFENIKTQEHYRGTGSYSGMKKEKNILCEFKANTFQENKDYTVSVWMYNNYKDALNLWFRLIVEEFDEDKNEWYETVAFPEQSEVINGNWSLVELKFKIHNSNNKLYIVTIGKEDEKAPFTADDLLIRESGLNVYKIINQHNDSIIELFKNNQKVIANNPNYFKP